jgi:hypothetical protein
MLGVFVLEFIVLCFKDAEEHQRLGDITYTP